MTTMMAIMAVVVLAAAADSQSVEQLLAQTKATENIESLLADAMVKPEKLEEVPPVVAITTSTTTPAPAPSPRRLLFRHVQPLALVQKNHLLSLGRRDYENRSLIV